MKIADITCDSDISQFLNLSELEGLLSDINSGEVDKLKEKVVVPISKEIKSGGLDEYSVNIGGNPIYNEKAVVLTRSLEAAFSDLNRVYLGFISAGRKHLTEEINTYISKLNEKISELDKISKDYKYMAMRELDNLEKQRDYLQQSKDATDKKNQYSEKLEIAKALLQQTTNWSSSPQAGSVNVSENNNIQVTDKSIKPKSGLITAEDNLIRKFEL